MFLGYAAAASQRAQHLTVSPAYGPSQQLKPNGDLEHAAMLWGYLGQGGMLFAEAWHQTCLTRAALYHIYFELGVGVQEPFWLIFHVRLSTGVRPSNLPLTTQTLTEMLEYHCAKSSQHSLFRNQALQLLSLHLHVRFLVFSVKSAAGSIFSGLFSQAPVQGVVCCSALCTCCSFLPLVWHVYLRCQKQVVWATCLH